MDGEDADRLPPPGLTGARLIGIVLVVVILLVATLGLVEWINRGAADSAPPEAEAGIDAPP